MTAPRSATVEAQTSVCAAVLTRAAYEQLAREHPAIVQRLLTNLALALAARVRSANQLATARQRRHP
jgi:SulP family sulfate permease